MSDFPRINYLGDLIRERYLRKHIQQCQSGNPSGVALDVGAGTGQYSHLMTEKGYQYFGIDIEPRHENIKKMSAEDLSEIRFSRKFSIVISIDVLEHLENPKKAVEEIRKSLDFGGVAYIHTPNKWQTHILYPHPHQEDHKVDGFTELELRQLFSKFLRIDIIPTFNTYEALAWELANIQRLNNGQLDIMKLADFDAEKYNNLGWLCVCRK